MRKSTQQSRSNEGNSRAQRTSNRQAGNTTNASRRTNTGTEYANELRPQQKQSKSASSRGTSSTSSRRKSK